MNHKTLPLLFLAIYICMAPGCGSSQKEEAKPELALEGSIPVKVGQTFQIKLPANPTGGYGWAYRTDLEKTHLKEVKRSFQEVAKEQATPDLTGYETWAFTALEKGTTSIELVYKQHWKEDGVPTKTYLANVIIT